MNVDLNTVMNISGVTALTAIYERFLLLFPAPLHWIVSLIVLVSIAVAFFTLIRFHWIFFILLILILPVAFPVLKTLFAGLYDLFLYLLHQVAAGIPKDLVKQ